MRTRAPALITTIMVMAALFGALLVAILAYRLEMSSHGTASQAITVVSATTPDATSDGFHDI